MYVFLIRLEKLGIFLVIPTNLGRRYATRPAHTRAFGWLKRLENRIFDLPKVPDGIIKNYPPFGTMPLNP